MRKEDLRTEKDGGRLSSDTNLAHCLDEDWVSAELRTTCTQLLHLVVLAVSVVRLLHEVILSSGNFTAEDVTQETDRGIDAI